MQDAFCAPRMRTEIKKDASYGIVHCMDKTQIAS